MIIDLFERYGVYKKKQKRKETDRLFEIFMDKAFKAEGIDPNYVSAGKDITYEAFLQIKKLNDRINCIEKCCGEIIEKMMADRIKNVYLSCLLKEITTEMKR